MAAASPIVDTLAPTHGSLKTLRRRYVTAPRGRLKAGSWTIASMQPLEPWGPPDGYRADRATPLDDAGAGEAEALLWRVADILRGGLDVSEYREFVLGLIFLRYASEAFDEHRRELATHLAAEGVTDELVDDRVEERATFDRAGALWVPEYARWSWIAARAEGRSVARRLDEAMEALMRSNRTLADALPVVYRRGGMDDGRLAELVELVGDIRFDDARRSPKETLGDVYEYFLAGFAQVSSTPGGGFHTPRSVVRLMVALVEPGAGLLYDPACGTGGMFVEASAYARATRGPDTDLRFRGHESDQRTWRLARMNLTVHGIDGRADVRWRDTLKVDKSPRRKSDFVLTAPPRDTSPTIWLRHVYENLDARGTGCLLLPNGFFNSSSKARAELLERDLIAGVIALPSRLFGSPKTSASLWVLSGDKGRQEDRRLAERRGEILFVDAREAGTMVDRSQRVLTQADLTRISETYHAWRGTASAQAKGLAYADVPGFCATEGLARVRQHNYLLSPSRYTHPETAGRPTPRGVRVDLASLTRDLYSLFD
ncbi:type I restriction-modification system subunit M [Streptomyces zaomyceticus]|uniref:type I restriction-modification system subunit M n=1 Tax=Streptomyces zaomyceticus TaxID=68286 RepID=UPI001676C043|nr:class I SAM-dependent DNA methyltransferase [Streptomyces zaomyceticus]GHG00157.1 type I restriction endonuclease subunit M [Streptomyces zaomyceticus]